MAPQNSTLIHDSSDSATATIATATAVSSAEELSSFSPILPPRNHRHHHHHHHHHHHRNQHGQTRQSGTRMADGGAPVIANPPDEGPQEEALESLMSVPYADAISSAAVGKRTTTANGQQAPSRCGSFRDFGPAHGSSKELQSLPAGWTGRDATQGSTGRTCGTGRGIVKRELLNSIPCHRHTHSAKQYAESLESDDNVTTYDTDDAYEGSPEPSTETPPTGMDPGLASPATDIEIPIWIRGEARFVSGINGTTTCSNIIRALIDDEILNGNYGSEDVAVSRDVNDYVIIERWREVEQVLAGDTRILSIWNAWGNAQNEVQFRLKINKTNLERGPTGKENKSKKQKEKIGLINRMMRKVLKQGEAIQNHLSQISQKSTEKRQQEKFRKYVRKNCGKHLIMENFLHDAATGSHLSDLSVDGEPLVASPTTVTTAVAAGGKGDSKEKVRRSTFPGKLLFSARKSPSTSGAGEREKGAGRVLRNVLFESSDQLADGVRANEDELLLVIDHTSDSDSGIFTNNALSRRDTLPKRPNFGSMVEIDRHTKDPDDDDDEDGAAVVLEVDFGRGTTDSARRQQKYHRSKRRYDSLRCHHQNRRRELDYALSEDDGVASSSGRTTSELRGRELVDRAAGDEHCDAAEVSEGDVEHRDETEDVTPPVDDFEEECEQVDLRKGTFNRTSFRFDLIRQEIATKMAEMQHLVEQEEELLRRLKLKSAKFHAENQIYRSHIGLDFHVERLQQSIDRCAKEIIDIEQQLLETKMEIEEKSPLIDNLRALLETQELQCYRRPVKQHAQVPPEQRYGMTTHFRSGSVDGTARLSADTSFTQAPQRGGSSSRNSLTQSAKRRSNPSRPTNESVEFVDNIYEFCDNNQSFVV